jgi:hypothetical protein
MRTGIVIRGNPKSPSIPELVDYDTCVQLRSSCRRKRAVRDLPVPQWRNDKLDFNERLEQLPQSLRDVFVEKQGGHAGRIDHDLPQLWSPFLNPGLDLFGRHLEIHSFGSFTDALHCHERLLNIVARLRRFETGEGFAPVDDNDFLARFALLDKLGKVPPGLIGGDPRHVAPSVSSSRLDSGSHGDRFAVDFDSFAA